jgi:multidrug efflux pump subunit AcrA (membrane-fusion protein)
LLEIVDLNTLELEAALSPSDAMDVRVGQTAMLSLEGQEPSVSAQVQRINPNVQPGSRSVLVYLRLDKPQGLRQGLYGQGVLTLGRRQALAMPLSHVRTDKPEPYVQVVSGNRLLHQPVTLGQRGRVGQEDTVWVEVQGIVPGTQVLSARVGPMRDGLSVRVVAPAAKPTPSNKP